MEIGIPSAVGKIDGKSKVSKGAKCGHCPTLSRCRSTCERLDRLWRERRDIRKYQEGQLREYKRMEQFANRWMNRMMRIRRRKMTKLDRVMREWRKHRDRAANVYPWIATLLSTKLDRSRKFNHLVGRRHLMKEDNGGDIQYIVSVMRCKVIFDDDNGGYKSFEICVDYNGNDYLSVGVNVWNANETLMSAVGSESDLIYHFEEYQWDFDITMDMEVCSEFIGESSLRMCVENGAIDAISGVKVFVVDEDVQRNSMEAFDGEKRGNMNVFIGSFEDEHDWNETVQIHLDGNMSWTKKCHHDTFSGVRICLEQFDRYHFRASMRMRDGFLERE